MSREMKPGGHAFAFATSLIKTIIIATGITKF